MRLMLRRGGHPTDASKDYDYTDWAAATSSVEISRNG
jgi:menaquinone-dependent protoporphyrinogen IX oxidase